MLAPCNSTAWSGKGEYVPNATSTYLTQWPSPWLESLGRGSLAVTATARPTSWQQRGG